MTKKLAVASAVPYRGSRRFRPGIRPMAWAWLVCLALPLSTFSPARAQDSGVADRTAGGSASGSGAPELLSVRPSVVPPHLPLELELVGTGFGAGAVVEIEGNRPGRFLRFTPAEVEADRLHLLLPLGFGGSPAERRIRVVDAAGRRSAERMLRVDASAAAAAENTDGHAGTRDSSTGAEDAGPPGTDPELDPSETEPDESGPRIVGLWPEPLPVGRPVRLEVEGDGFEDGARVVVEVNVHAGSDRLPDYATKVFDADLVDARTLEVHFDRGFFPHPAVRDLWVRNPDGRESPPALLRLAPEPRARQHRFLSSPIPPIPTRDTP